MNQFILTTVCLLITSTLTFAQQNNLDAPDSDNLLAKIIEPVPSADQLTEYTPLNNVPFFPGGQKALETYLNDHRPSNAEQREGTVHIRFRVMPTGQLTEIKVIESSEPLLNQAAMQAIVRMPRWYPAHRSGVAVSSLYVLPVTFRSR
ncbi:energy transducer TonB [Spirosoma fluviale]|uniref:TonB family C-terminal domain-containing protein n=1 Tax=Spirosoma fluviale TaxID=1597977 RepID=A0A286GVM5_9BACT|nr:energy transducer TonB [Spirosoma fluviale]SOD99551.1 TonB family C-terminal domain-containing protein [Spirosoma fluviale]